MAHASRRNCNGADEETASQCPAWYRRGGLKTNAKSCYYMATRAPRVWRLGVRVAARKNNDAMASRGCVVTASPNPVAKVGNTRLVLM